MEHYCFDQSEADNMHSLLYLFSYTLSQDGPVVMDVADTDAYISAIAISRRLPGHGMLRIQKNRRLSCATVWQLKKCITVLCNYTVLQAMTLVQDSMAKSKPSL